jgi:adenosylmethionine-8-amino-7-oxononanoate aminotransferase
MIFAWDIKTTLPDFPRRYVRNALSQGVALRPIGRTLYAMPPYVINEEECSHLAQGMFAALEETLAEEADATASSEAITDGV